MRTSFLLESFAIFVCLSSFLFASLCLCHVATREEMLVLVEMVTGNTRNDLLAPT